MKRALLPALLVGAASLLSFGCASHVAYAGYYGPPAPRVERYGFAPGPGYVWTPGYYVWSGGGYNWVGGRWAAPPRPHAIWVPGHYVRRSGHSEYVGGHWR
jgi:hypothetical protein